MDDTQAATSNKQQAISDTEQSVQTETPVQDQAVQQPASAPVQEPVSEPVAAQAPPAPVSVPHKESEPVGTSLDSVDLLKHSEVSPEIPQEIKEVGVSEVSEHPQISPDVKKLGVELTHEAQKPALGPSGTFQSPMTQKEANHILKAHKKIADSLVWLAALVVKQFKKTTIPEAS